MNRPPRPQWREWCPRGVMRRLPNLVQACLAHGVPCHDCIVIEARRERLARALQEALQEAAR